MLKAYEELYRMNTAYEQVISSISALRKERAFNRTELACLADQAREARASANAYLTEVLQEAELAEAGRLFKRRVRRERKQNGGS